MFRSKGFLAYKKKELTPDVTPLIDVIFLLLIFFMVSTTFNKNGGLKIDLPTSKISEVEKKYESLSVILSKDKEIIIRVENKTKKTDLPVNKENLKQVIQENLSNTQEKRVSIVADKTIFYGDIVEIMSEIKLSGATGIDIETIEKES
ncbi:MAG: ExbD/TolR family protein [Fusobacteriaceae bacterium]